MYSALVSGRTSAPTLDSTASLPASYHLRMGASSSGMPKLRPAAWPVLPSACSCWAGQASGPRARVYSRWLVLSVGTIQLWASLPPAR